MLKLENKKGLTVHQIQLKELTQIWVDKGNDVTFNRIYDMLKPFLINYFNKKNIDSEIAKELANDVLLFIYIKRSKWIGGEYPNLQNYSLTVAKGVLSHHIEATNAKKRRFENISIYNKDAIFLDDDYCDNEIYDKYNHIEKFCFDNNIISNPSDEYIIYEEKEKAQDALLQKCIDHLLKLREKKENNITEKRNLDIFIEFFNGLNVLDIVKKYDMSDNIKSNQYVQHIFYRYRQKLQKIYQKDYDRLMSVYGNVDKFNRLEQLVD